MQLSLFETLPFCNVEIHRGLAHPDGKPQARTQIAREIKDEIFARQNNKCIFCEREMVRMSSEFAGLPHPPMMSTIEHIVPISKGGLDIPENMVGSCLFCNSTRGTMDFKDFGQRVFANQYVRDYERAVRNFERKKFELEKAKMIAKQRLAEKHKKAFKHIRLSMEQMVGNLAGVDVEKLEYFFQKSLDNMLNQVKTEKKETK